MKGIVVLILALFLAAPVHGQLTEEKVAQIMNAALVPVMNELRVMKEEFRVMKEDVRVVKEDVRELKEEFSELKEEFSVVKKTVQAGEVALSGLQSEVRGNGTRITDVRVQLTWQSSALLTVSGLLVTLLLWLLKRAWDERRAEREELAEKQVELAEKQAEIVQLRAENERLKPQIFTERGEPANVSRNVP